jgi:hypothetical protein
MLSGKQNVVSGALLALLLAAGAWCGASLAVSDAQPVVAPGAHSGAPADAGAGRVGVAAAAPLAGPAATPAPAGRSWLSGDLAPVEPLALQLQRLGASGDPHDAYRAYRLVRACKAVRTHAQPAPGGPADDTLAGMADPAAFCASVNDRMRMDSVALLERAARANVDGAMDALVEEGPFGDPAALVTRPGDPLVKAWKDRINGMLVAQAGQGNWSSLYVLFTGFMFSNPAIDADRQSALAYGIALRDIIVKVDGVTEDEAIPFNGPFLDQVKVGLSREQQDRAVAQAASIVDTALRQRLDAQRQAQRPAI